MAAAAARQVLGSTIFQKSYLRNNLRAVLESSMDHVNLAYTGNFDVAACELANFAVLRNGGINGGLDTNDILVIPCVSKLAQDNLALVKNTALEALHSAVPEIGVANLFNLNGGGKADYKIFDHVGLYIVLVEKFTESEPADDRIHISGRFIMAIPPILANADGPVFDSFKCNPFFVFGSEVLLSARRDGSFLLANDALRAELTFQEYSALVKRNGPSTLEETVKPTPRNAAGFTVSTNDGRAVQIYEKSTHDKTIQLTQAFMRLLWSSPAKRVAFFGAYDHRYDATHITEAISAAYVAAERGPEWSTVSYYPQLQKLRVYQDPTKLEKCLCWKATAADHNVFCAQYLLPSDVPPYFGGTNHYHIFAAMRNLGILLSVFIHEGYDKIFDDVEATIRTTSRLDKVPDYVLAYVFVIMLESIGKELNDMTLEGGSADWETDREKGVLLIKRHAAKFFTADYCVRIHDDWNIFHKDSFIPWSESATASPATHADSAATKGNTDYCLRNLKHFFSFTDKGKPAVACTSVGCEKKHLVVGSALNKDAITRWILKVNGADGKPTKWRVDLAAAVKNF